MRKPPPAKKKRGPDKVAIIGPGVVGRAIGRLLHRRGFVVAAVAGTSGTRLREAIRFIGAGKAVRSAASAARAAEIVFITTPDRAIRTTCDEIAAANGFRRKATVLHCSGALGADALASARARGAAVASLHPMQSFASPEEALRRMKGTVFMLEGDEAAAPAAQRVVNALGGTLVRLPPGSKALYHAAGCVISNYMVALADLGMNMLRLSGMSGADAARAAQPLLRGTVENIAALGPPGALTGPIARGDAQTVENHLRAMASLPPDIRRLYAVVGLYTVRVAQRKGTLHPPESRALVRLLSDAARA